MTRDVRVRLATPEDEATLRALAAEHPLESGLSVTEERPAGWFAPYALFGGPHAAFVAEDARGRAVGTGAYAVRTGLLDGARVRVGYITDLRVRAHARGTGVVSAIARTGVAHARDVHGVDVFQAAVLDANARGRGMIARSTPARRDQPVPRLMTRYEMVNVHPVRPRWPRRVHVRHARVEDAPRIEAFLAREEARRVLGHVVGPGFLDARAAAWPGFAVTDFLLALDADEIIGCVAPWDASRVKARRVLAYGRALDAFRRAHALAARWGGWAPLPRPGERFSFPFLTHLNVAHDDPRVLRALVDAALVDAARRGEHFVSLMMPRDAPMRAGLRGRLASRVPLSLHALVADGDALAERDWRTTRPGFEMALA